MDKWQIVSIRYGEEAEYLDAGWEPFAVSPHNTSYQIFNTSLNRYETQYQSTDYIYLRRRIEL